MPTPETPLALHRTTSPQPVSHHSSPLQVYRKAAYLAMPFPPRNEPHGPGAPCSQTTSYTLIHYRSFRQPRSAPKHIFVGRPHFHHGGMAGRRGTKGYVAPRSTTHEQRQPIFVLLRTPGRGDRATPNPEGMSLLQLNARPCATSPRLSAACHGDVPEQYIDLKKAPDAHERPIPT